jgi:threonine/homoserine/homoserine lactone efflux protein
VSAASTLATLAGVHLAVLATPGPNTMIVLRNATRARRLGVAAAAGVFLVAAFWMCAGMLGLGALFRAFPRVETAMTLICGAYLVWLGGRALAASLAPARLRVEAASAATTTRRAFAEGFFTNLANPKTIAYVSSVFVATGAVDLPLAWRVAALTMMPVMSFAYYAALALAASSRPVAALLAGGRVWLDRAVGGLMIGFGLKLIAQR